MPLQGLGLHACLGASLVPLVRALLGKHARSAGTFLLVFTAVLAGLAALKYQPYSVDHPKRLLLEHWHITEPAPAPAAPASDELPPPGGPAVHMRVTQASWVLGGADSNSLDVLLPSLGFAGEDRWVPPAGWPLLASRRLSLHPWPLPPCCKDGTDSTTCPPCT